MPTSDKKNEELSPEQRIRLAEAEEIEALRDILKAEARSAAAEATMMENMVEVDKAVGHAVMSIYGQGPLPSEDNPIPVWLGALGRQLGKALATDLAKKGFDWIKDKLQGIGEKQKGRAEQTKQNASKEAVAKGTALRAGGDIIIGGDVAPSPGSSVSPGGPTTGP